VPALFAVLVAVAALAAVPVHYSGKYFVFSPGTAPVITTSAQCKPQAGQLTLPSGAPCVRLVVPPSKAHHMDGRLLMVDVEVSRASPLQWIAYELGLLGSHSELVTVASYADGTPTSELGCQDTQQMVSAGQAAAIAALGALQYRVAERPLGAQVVEVLPGTPAWRAGVHCNDLITAVNGKPVNSAAEFGKLMAPLRPGTLVTLTDHPGGGRQTRLIRARLAKPPRRVAEGGSTVPFTDRAYLGVAVSTKPELVLPFHVSVDAGAIGGPSAGLAFTLAILDSLSGGKLTGGHVVAATGTISPNGEVGEVGGVREKTVAVEKAGAQVFFVPAAEYSQARSVASKDLHVVPVSTLHQALEILAHDYGGVLARSAA